MKTTLACTKAHRRPKWLVTLLVTMLCLLATQSSAMAHGGGTPRLTNAEAGPYRVYAWSQPEPLLAGEVHLSIMLTVPATEQAGDSDATQGAQVEKPVTDAEVDVTFRLAGAPELAYTAPAVPQNVLNDIYYDTELELPNDGVWQVTIAANGPSGAGSTNFALPVLPAQRVNWTLIAAGGITLVILLGLIILWSRMRSPAAGSSSMADTANRKQVHG